MDQWDEEHKGKLRMEAAQEIIQWWKFVVGGFNCHI